MVIFRTKFSSVIEVIEERLLHQENVTVWCALWSESMIGLYFFENNNETTVTVNSERYGTI